MTTANSRQSEHSIDPIFLERWSPRAFTSETIAEADLMTMFDAAHWAASSYNAQPWRFLYALRDGAHWQTFVGLLLPFNQAWAKDAAALVALVSKTTMRPPGADADITSRSHSLDAGAASGYFALQATMMGWHVHGMAGFDAERAIAELNVPSDHHVEAVYAVGRRGDPSNLPEMLRARETPSPRQPLAEVVFEGGFKSA